MIPTSTLSMTQSNHEQLRQHLFPGDLKEAAAVLVCTRVPGERQRLLVRNIIPVPYSACSRRDDVSISWPSEFVEQGIDLAEPRDLALILIHSHPNGTPHFSDIDDRSDSDIIPCIFAACGSVHGTAVMLPNGFIFGRTYTPEMAASPIDLVSVIGSDLQFFWSDDHQRSISRPIAFTSEMTAELGRLTACVIGVSGTGSIVAEQICRLGFGQVILIEFDKVERKNLNRILNTVKEDADCELPKVQVFSDRANQYRDEPYVFPIEANVLSRKAVLAAAEADVLFCCVDKLRARSVADRLGQAFLLPLLDVGVGISTRRTENDDLAVDEVAGRIDYVQPGGSSLFDRGVYTAATLQAEALFESDPAAHADHIRRGYIEDIPEQAPAVITLNMRAASTSVMEFIARAYPFRQEPSDRYARTRFMLAEAIEEFTAENEFASRRSPIVARGDEEPLLGLPIFAEEERNK
ncbi:ThiF family adenylyltransferase [Burkholderia territorii]|uniref:ThiF family adenylyltransferase n=1 Tax=Burkholderia territorii TaxID=1503055 RepID=UPI00075E7384|nr:ThiF family adenylyltransferase [Burkholderia territorii]KWO58915.1 thiamine biosynthesis protein ThiF [Burkholderia territorii]